MTPCQAAFADGTTVAGVPHFEPCPNPASVRRCALVNQFCVMILNVCEPHASLLDDEWKENGPQMVQEQSGW